MKTGPDALGTVENDSRRAKHENGSRRPRDRRNQSGRAKHENVTRRPRHRCATLFRTFRIAAGGDGMQKKDTEIPPKRAFV
jgi:hypothetical protein